MLGFMPLPNLQICDRAKLSVANPNRSNNIGYYDYNNGIYEDPYSNTVAFGKQGFETFHFDIPDSLRGKSAQIKFELEGGNTVYLDDIFFKSVHLKLGNPTFARPNENTHEQNYLIEKPQYSLSYNNSIKGANWVSWQVNKSWIGSEERVDATTANIVGYPGNYLPDSDYSADALDYPWLPDNQLPNNWIKTESPDYRATNGSSRLRLDKGHLTPVDQRTRSLKDIYSTFFTNNALPQQSNSNQFGAWRRFEDYTTNLVNNNDKELFMIAGGYGYEDAVQAGFPQRKVSNNVLLKDGIVQTDANGRPIISSNPLKDNDGNFLPGSSVQPVENSKGIFVPEYLWKIAVVLEPGQQISDITEETEVIAIITPNRSTLH